MEKTETPAAIDADTMSLQEIHEKLQKGYEDIEKGNVQNAAKEFAQFREMVQNHKRINLAEDGLLKL